MNKYYYTYKIELLNESGNEVHNYFGSRISKVPPQEDDYMGSSKTHKNKIKGWPDNLKKKIVLEEYTNHTDMYEAEDKIITDNIDDKPRNLNMARANGKSLDIWLTYSTPEQRSEAVRKAKASMTPEQRSEAARKRLASMTPEQRSEIARKRQASMTPEQRSEAARKARYTQLQNSTPEQRSETSRKGNITRKLRKNSGNSSLDNFFE